MVGSTALTYVSARETEARLLGLRRNGLASATAGERTMLAVSTMALSMEHAVSAAVLIMHGVATAADLVTAEPTFWE